MRNIAATLYKGYSRIPYLFFAVFMVTVVVTAILNNGIVLNDNFFDLAPVKIMTVACVLGIFIFPLVATAVLFYDRRKWKKLAQPVLSYGLYLLAVVIAGNMGWWTD